nr:metallophosphoesterase [Bacteroidales bacterium]
DTGGGTLGELQLQWLKELLNTEREKFRNCIVITHNNIIKSRFTISTLPMQEEVKVLLDLFLKHKVDYCITGHDHKYDAFTFGNTHYVVTDALLDGYKNAAYLKLNIKDGTISVRHHSVIE